MENIKIFNSELFSLYDQKPPISKAKMASITRSAMKAIKFYKHVVQSVEKFILKCKTEYKIPGLYVIDSIVRQSRHQFGADKDLFAPRFARNMEVTFANLFSCPVEDKSKIIRVLNLWQKNSVFAPDVIQPLFDLANPDHPIHQQISNQQANQDNSSFSNGMNLSNISHDSPVMNEAPANQANANTIESATGPSSQQLDTNTIRQLQQFQQMLMRQTNNDANSQSQSAKDTVKFNKKLLDYDYGSDEDEDKNKSPKLPNIPDPNNIAQILSDPNVLKQLQNLQKLKQHELEEKQTKLSEMRKQEEAFEKHLATVLKKLPFASECDLSRTNVTSELHQSGSNVIYQNSISTYNTMMQAQPGQSSKDEKERDIDVTPDDGKVEVINLDVNDSRSPSPSRDRYKRRRSRSRSRERRGERSRRRSRSKSPSRSPRRRRSSRDRKDREHERERRKRGLPDMKKDHLSVCSTTLWVGHLSKLVQQEELSDTFGKFGDIVSINIINPRGCAYIVMNRRQDAFKSMQNLKNFKMQGRAITISWAAGKGVKSKEWKDYWDIDMGVSYIPYEKITPATNFETLEDGGMFDLDTVPAWMKEKLNTSKQFKIDGLPPTIPPQMFNLDTSQPPPASQIIQRVNPIMPAFPLSHLYHMPPPDSHMPPLGIGMGLNSILTNLPPPSISSVQPTAGSLAPNFNMLGVVPIMPPPPHISSTLKDDKMDIETDEEHHAKQNDGIFFNHPPPKIESNLFAGSKSNETTSSERMQDKILHTRDDSRERKGGRDRERGEYRDRERDNSWERNRNRSNRWRSNTRGDSRDRDTNSYDGGRDRRERSYDRIRDSSRSHRDSRRQDNEMDGNRLFLNQTGGFRDNSRRHADAGSMQYNDDSRPTAAMPRVDFKRTDDRRSYPVSRFPAPQGIRGPMGPRGPPMLNFVPRGPIFIRGGRSQGFRFNSRPNFEEQPNYSDDKEIAPSSNTQINKSRADDVAGFDEGCDEKHDKKLSRWEKDGDKNKNIKTDYENGKHNIKSDMFEDKADQIPPGKPIYEDKGPPGHEDQVDVLIETKSDPTFSTPSPSINININKQAETKPSNEAIFGHTTPPSTPLFDELAESAPMEQKVEENNKKADVETNASTNY